MGIDHFGCINNTIKVFSGHYFDLANPTPETVDIVTIAHCLARECRYGNHTPEHYSVAEHLLHCTDLAERDGVRGDVLKAVFLHDAAEAYLRDLSKPLKVMLPEYSRIESRVSAAVAKRFGVDFDANYALIKKYDRIMLKAEKQQIWPNDAEKWNGFGGIAECDIELEFHSFEVAKRMYLDIADQLGVK